jgi:hypothetical protein
MRKTFLIGAHLKHQGEQRQQKRQPLTLNNDSRLVRKSSNLFTISLTVSLQRSTPSEHSLTRSNIPSNFSAA